MANHLRRGIPAPRRPPDQQPLRFSFKHIDLQNAKFDTAKCPTGFFQELLVQLQTFSTWTVDRFTDVNDRERRHVIWFTETTEPEGFAHVPNIDADQLGFHEAWQFCVCPDDHINRWRVHGILIDDTFYIVWLDPDHALYGR